MNLVRRMIDNENWIGCTISWRGRQPTGVSSFKDQVESIRYNEQHACFHQPMIPNERVSISTICARVVLYLGASRESFLQCRHGSMRHLRKTGCRRTGRFDVQDSRSHRQRIGEAYQRTASMHLTPPTAGVA